MARFNNTALITGASSGIGAEFAKLHASKGGDLVLVARDQERLNEVKQSIEKQYKVNVLVVAQDLAKADAAQLIFTKTEEQGIDIEILINNAGFGGHGKFHERELAADLSMIQVNIVALTSLTRLYLPKMVENNSGKILNISSTASFMPGPLQAVYYATKAFVTSFTQAIANELEEYNVTATALCPGTVNTGFVKAGNLEGLDAWKNAKSPESVALCGYEAMEKGELVAINEPSLSFMLKWIIPLMPRKAVLKMSRQFMEKK